MQSQLSFHNEYLGCVPKKLMVFASRYPGEIAEMAGYGWKGATPGEFDWKTFLDAKNQVSMLVYTLTFFMLHSSNHPKQHLNRKLQG